MPKWAKSVDKQPTWLTNQKKVGGDSDYWLTSGVRVGKREAPRPGYNHLCLMLLFTTAYV